MKEYARYVVQVKYRDGPQSNALMHTNESLQNKMLTMLCVGKAPAVAVKASPEPGNAVVAGDFMLIPGDDNSRKLMQDAGVHWLPSGDVEIVERL